MNHCHGSAFSISWRNEGRGLGDAFEGRCAAGSDIAVGSRPIGRSVKRVTVIEAAQGPWGRTAWEFYSLRGKVSNTKKRSLTSRPRWHLLRLPPMLAFPRQITTLISDSRSDENAQRIAAIVCDTRSFPGAKKSGLGYENSSIVLPADVVSRLRLCSACSPN